MPITAIEIWMSTILGVLAVLSQPFILRFGSYRPDRSSNINDKKNSRYIPHIFEFPTLRNDQVRPPT